MSRTSSNAARSSAYILNRLPGVKAVNIDGNGEMQETEFEF